jgi:hypothetical protein
MQKNHQEFRITNTRAQRWEIVLKRLKLPLQPRKIAEVPPDLFCPTMAGSEPVDPATL